MKSLLVLLRGDKDNAQYPAILAAAQCYEKAVATQCERIRVEVPGGFVKGDFPLAQVAAFRRAQGFIPQRDPVLRRFTHSELHRPMWAMGGRGRHGSG